MKIKSELYFEPLSVPQFCLNLWINIDNKTVKIIDSQYQ